MIKMKSLRLTPTPRERAAFIKRLFRKTHYNSDILNGPCDLLADLMHYCEQGKQSFDYALESARQHFKAERKGVK